MNDSMPESRPRRVRPGLRRLAIVAFILLIPIAAHAVWDQIEVGRLVREIERIRSKGEPLTQREAGYHFSGNTEEHKRASRQYLAAAMLVLHVRNRPEFAELREWLYGRVPLKAPPGDIASRLDMVVEDGREALTLASQANALEFRGFEPGTEYSYRSSGLTSLTHVVSSRTVSLALKNRGDEAVDSAIASLRLRRVERDARWLYLMNPADHQVPVILSFSSPSPDALKRIQMALESAEASYDPAKEIAGWRATAIEMLWRRYYGSDPQAPRAYTLPLRSITEMLYRPLFTHKLVEMLRTWSDLLEAARKPWPEKMKATARVADVWHAEAKSRSRFVPPALMGQVQFMPFEAVDADRLITDRAARTAVAIERFRRDHGGGLPKTLADLVPIYLSVVPGDPSSGGPLLFRQDSDSYTIYGVGIDGKDDGGDLSSELEESIKRAGRRVLRGRDAGIRILIH